MLLAIAKHTRTLLSPRQRKPGNQEPLGRPTQQITSGRKTGRSGNLGRQTQFRILVGASDPQATANTISVGARTKGPPPSPNNLADEKGQRVVFNHARKTLQPAHSRTNRVFRQRARAGEKMLLSKPGLFYEFWGPTPRAWWYDTPHLLLHDERERTTR